jgi:hypothetical protein
MINKDSINNRLFFSNRRLSELKQLNNGDIAGADIKERQQLIQEFFFHLVGSIEFLLQLINDSKQFGIEIEDVNIRSVCSNLPGSDPLKTLLNQLHPTTRNRYLTVDPYSDEGCHFRIMVFRHRVCHHGDNPFFFRLGSLPKSSLFIDPRNRNMGGSEKAVFDELEKFWNLIYDKCQRAIQLLNLK